MKSCAEKEFPEYPGRYLSFLLSGETSLQYCFAYMNHTALNIKIFLSHPTLQTWSLLTFLQKKEEIYLRLLWSTLKEDMSLQVLDSEDGAVIASYCGSGIPDPLTSSGSILYIRLISTSYAIGNRFRASWSTGTMLNFYS